MIAATVPAAPSQRQTRAPVPQRRGSRPQASSSSPHPCTRAQASFMELASGKQRQDQCNKRARPSTSAVHAATASLAWRKSSTRIGQRIAERVAGVRLLRHQNLRKRREVGTPTASDDHVRKAFSPFRSVSSLIRPASHFALFRESLAGKTSRRCGMVGYSDPTAASPDSCVAARRAGVNLGLIPGLTLQNHHCTGGERHACALHL